MERHINKILKTTLRPWHSLEQFLGTPERSNRTQRHKDGGDEVAWDKNPRVMFKGPTHPCASSEPRTVFRVSDTSNGGISCEMGAALKHRGSEFTTPTPLPHKISGHPNPWSLTCQFLCVGTSPWGLRSRLGINTSGCYFRENGV